MAKRLVGFNMETEEERKKRAIRNDTKIPSIDPSKYNVTKAGNVIKKTPNVGSNYKPCPRVKETLLCKRGGKECNNKNCAIVKMGYKAENFEGTPTQQKIKDILSGMTDLLLYKNKKYGDSAINPKKIFYKGDITNSILIRLDDKIGRVMSNTEEKPRVNDVADIIGYCTLLLVSMGITSEDLKKFMD